MLVDGTTHKIVVIVLFVVVFGALTDVIITRRDDVPSSLEYGLVALEAAIGT